MATPILRPNFRNACPLFCRTKFQTLQTYLLMIYDQRTRVTIFKWRWRAEVLKENPGLEDYLGHAVDVIGSSQNRCAVDVCLIRLKSVQEELSLWDKSVHPKEDLPEDAKVLKILNWPPLTLQKDKSLLGYVVLSEFDQDYRLSP